MSPAPAIAVDLDDTLNNFTEILRHGEFARDDHPALSAERFREYLVRLRRGADETSGLVSTEYTFFRYRIHHECYRRARPRTDGVAFLQWLRANGWRIVICTRRDLRRAQDATRQWLAEHGIPFDCLFMAGNKIAFCRLWGIRYLVDDDPFTIAHGEPHGVSVFYPAAAAAPPPGAAGSPAAARAFQSFDQIIPWIRG
jgi:hypothetical protein